MMTGKSASWLNAKPRWIPGILALLFVLSACQAPQQWSAYECAAGDAFPAETWAKVDRPEDIGWSSERLAEAQAHATSIGSTAVMVVKSGIVVDAWGEVATKSNLHSVRKSLLSGLIGIAVDEGKIDLNQTLAELAIDDNEPSLTDLEKQATVGDLIKARSGIYHPALYETARMTALKPARGSHEPGTFFHYNNWDFNTLGTIYEDAVGESIFEAFDRRIAGPLRMEDYTPGDGEYVTGWQSIHPAYPFRMTARDLARFALLYLREGRWGDRRIVSVDWVQESTAGDSWPYQGVAYGYMWWTTAGSSRFGGAPVGAPAYYASGWHGQYAFVFPDLDLVVVHRVNTDHPHRAPRDWEVGKLLQLIVSAETGHATKCPPNRKSGSGG